MIKLSFYIDGVKKTFEKKEITVNDNLLAVEHQIRQTNLINSESNQIDVKAFREMNEEYLKMFVEIFDNQFTVEDLKKATDKTLDQLAKIYLEALGGEEEKEGKKGKSKAKK